MTRDEVNDLGAMLHKVRDHFSGDRVVISFGVIAPSFDCKNGSTVATVRDGSDEATCEAVHLYDAIHMARGKIDQDRARAKAAKDRAKAADPAAA